VKKLLVIVIFSLLFVSCSKKVVGIYKESGGLYTAYGWTESDNLLVSYTAIIESNGNSTLTIRYFKDVLSSINKEEPYKTIRKMGVKISNIEEAYGKIISITVNNTKYVIEE